MAHRGDLGLLRNPCNLLARAQAPPALTEGARHGPVAQWKSVPFTPGRSLVRSQPGPPGQSVIAGQRALTVHQRV